MRTTIARTCVRRASDPEVLPWNLMIGASVQSGQSQEALQMFIDMQSQGFLPDQVTLVTLLSACAKLASMLPGKCLHAIIPFTHCYPDVTLGTALLTMYGKCGSIQHALRAFDSMPIKNVVTYNAIISSCVHVSDIKQACGFLHLMQSEDICPNRITFLTILNECTGKLDLDEGKWLHDSIVRHGLVCDLVLATLLVGMYGECNCLEDAQRVFDMLPERDVVLWSSLIALLSCLETGKAAQKLFEQMKQECVMPDNVTYVSVIDASAVEGTIYEGRRVHACILLMVSRLDVIPLTSLINMYGKCGDIHSAVHVFDAITEPSVVSWNAMLGVYAHLGDSKNALQLFNNMQQEGAMPNHVTFTSILDSCADIATLKEGKQLHTVLINYGLDGHVNAQTALVNMYGKCGSLKTAYEMFDKMEKRNVVTWTAIISAFAQHGHCLEAMQLFDQMQEEKVKADIVTFLSILSACKYAGLIDEAYQWLNIMVQEHDLSPAEKHYDCMVDLLGRTGRLDEAEELINRTPHVPSAVTWTALLGSCRNQVDVERGERAAICMLKTNPEECASYTSLSNVYFAAGRNEDGASLMLQMKEIGLNKASTFVMVN